MSYSMTQHIVPPEIRTSRNPVTGLTKLLVFINPSADPGIYFRGVQAQQSLDNGFFFQSSTNLTVYRVGPEVLLQGKLYFSRIQRGPTFSRGGGGGGGFNFFQGGPNANF